MTYGLSLSYTWPDGDSASFWAMGPLAMDPITKTGFLTLIPFKDQATSGFPVVPNWSTAKMMRKIVFNVPQNKWPFAPGTDAVQKAFGYILLQTVSDETGGIDWTTATAVTV